MHAQILAILLFFAGASLVKGIDPEASWGIFGIVEQNSIPVNIGRLERQCYRGFDLRNCVDKNESRKGVTVESNLGVANQNFCLECCDPDRISLIADETWDLECPLENVVNTKLSMAELEFRFPRKLTLIDESVTVCSFTRNRSMRLHGYKLNLVVREMSMYFGFKYWRAVLSCTVQPIEDPSIPFVFRERLHLTTDPGEAQTSYLLLGLAATISFIVVFFSIPIYMGCVKGQRCLNCASWWVYFNGLCITCIVCGCRLKPAPAKVFSVDDLSSSSSDSDTDSKSFKD